MSLILLRNIGYNVYNSNGFGWIRIFGFGLYWKDLEKYQLFFSERNDIRNSIKYKKWYISYLPFFK